MHGPVLSVGAGGSELVTPENRARSYSVAQRMGLGPTHLPKGWGWVLLTCPKDGAGSYSLAQRMGLGPTQLRQCRPGGAGRWSAEERCYWTLRRRSPQHRAAWGRGTQGVFPAMMRNCCSLVAQVRRMMSVCGTHSESNARSWNARCCQVLYRKTTPGGPTPKSLLFSPVPTAPSRGFQHWVLSALGPHFRAWSVDATPLPILTLLAQWRPTRPTRRGCRPPPPHFFSGHIIFLRDPDYSNGAG